MYPDAACRDEDPELFFPERKRGWMSQAYARQYAEAKAVCDECPIRARCLEDNLDVPDGIWGGLDPTDRGRLLIARGRTRGKDRASFRNMSPFPNDHQVIAQRARREAEIAGDTRKIANARAGQRRRERQRLAAIA